MMAAKHMDPIVGVDTHILMVPSPAAGAPVPTPLPNPFVGIVFDPFDYLPIIGATVFINGLPRAQAGTAGVALPMHLPLGGPFAPPPPGNEAEVFMGSQTVISDGDVQSHMGLQALTCQSIGMPAPVRPKGQPAKSLVLPTSTVLSIPMGMPIMIGGPPVISFTAMAMKAGVFMLANLGKMVRKSRRGAGKSDNIMKAASEKAKAAGDDVADNAKLGPKAQQPVDNSACTVTGHPVDVATGMVFTDKTDIELAGPLPFSWKRSWSSTSTYQGELGHGWHHGYGHALYVQPDVVLYRNDEGRAISFPPIEPGIDFLHRTERLTLMRAPSERGGGYSLRKIDGTRLVFAQGGRPDGEQVLSAIESPSGDRVLFRYDDSGQLFALVDSADRLLELSRDSSGRIVAITAPCPDKEGVRRTLVQYRYDELGNLVQVVDALGQLSSYSYKRHLLVKEADRNGLSFYFEYDGADEHAKCIRTWGDGGIYDHKLRYDVPAGITWVQNSLGHTTQYRHHGGLVVETADPLGNITLTVYDKYNQKLKECDPLGNQTVWVYDERGNTTGVTFPDGGQLAITYGQAGTPEADKPVQATDTAGGAWKWRYDEKGRLLERTDPLGAITRYVYQGSRLSAVIDPLERQTRLTYDGAGLLTNLLGPDGTRNQWRYDRLGRVVKVIDANNNEQLRQWDLLGRVTRVYEPDGNVRELRYDGEGNAVYAKDIHHEVLFSYQGMGRLASRTEAGTTVRFRYDKEEQLTGIANEHGHVYRFELGPTGEVQVESGFDGIRRVYQRDAAGRVTQVERASGLVSQYKYDNAGRVTGVKHSDGTAENFSYRPDGALITAQNDSATVAFERDSLGRITKEKQGQHWVASQYDAVGMRIKMTSSLGAALDIERDAMGDVTRVKSAEGFDAHFKRDLLGLEIERALPGGVKSRWKRDQLGRPLSHKLTGGDKNVRDISYHWEANDRLARVVDGLNGTISYSHDELGSLAGAVHSNGTVELRMPDAVGNLFKTEGRNDRKYGQAGQLLESTDPNGRITRYSYDPEGNLIEKRTDNGQPWRYAWNAAGMLSKVTRPDGTEVSFQYDPLGRRIAKSYRGQTTRWVWDGNVPLHEWVEGELDPEANPNTRPATPTDPAIKRREAELSEHLLRGPPDRGTQQTPITWLFDPESFAPMAKLVNGKRLSIVTDYLGTPVSMLDDNGKQVWSASINVFGKLREVRGTAQACPFRWPGQYEDAETGLYYNRFRYYDPEAGAYVSQDPIGLAGGRALYAYPRDPTKSIDPLGFSCSTPRPGFYARPDGTLVPSTGYRHVSSQAPYLPELVKTGNVPANPKGTYFSFTKIDDAATAPGALQVPHDAAIRVEFDTLSVADDVSVPRGKWGEADYLEPLTTDFPQFGSGGATQAVTTRPIQATRIVDLRTGKVLYGG